MIQKMKLHKACLCLFAFFWVHLGVAELTPDYSWQAQWIGLELPAQVDLSRASWIWSNESGVDPTRNAPAGSRYFSHRVDVPTNNPVISAAALFSADNHFKLIINGKNVGHGDDWEHPVQIDVTSALHPGQNILLVQADNDVDQGPINAAGVIGKIHIERADHSTQEITTGEEWVSSTDPDASVWKPVRVLGAAGIAPWSAVPVHSASVQNLWTCYRKNFSLSEKPVAATARVAVDSKYWLWVNGQLVVYEGGLKRGPNPQDTYFDVIDLSPYLVKGDNQIAVLAWYWGKDGYSHKSSGKAGFVAELSCDGKIIATDTSWKALRHPAYGSTGDPHPNYRMPDDNIHFDARLDLGDWLSAKFDDSSWPAAKSFGRPPTAPWNQLVQRPIPQWRVSPLTKYENARELPRVSDGKPIVARLPRNLTISPYLKIKAPAGLTIDLRTDNYKGGSEYNYRSEYVTKEGVQEFESFAYLNGHWMIYTIPAGVEILDLSYRETRYDTDFTGCFECDDPFLNRLWIKCRNTMNVNMRDSIQDPDRERAQWWGDATILLGEIFYSCDAQSHALIRKAIFNLVDWQKPDGVIYSPVPAGSYDSELPQQMLASIGQHGFWFYYLYSGDKATIVHAYPAVKRYLSLWKLGADGLVAHRAGGWDWCDWGKNIDCPIMENALLYQALGAAIEMARLTGNDKDIPGYQAMRTSIEANYNRVLWAGHEYRSPGYKGKTDDRGHGLAVLYGLAKPEQWPAIKQVFTNSFEASPYTEKYILESLFKMGDTDAALARMKSRYRKMVESELSTLWEGWGIGAEGYGGGSYNHGWSGGPLTLLMQYVAGVSPTSPAFATYQIKPQMGSLKQANVTVPTVKGNIQLELQKAPGQFSLNLVSPAGTMATVGIPIASGETYSEVRLNAKVIWQKGQAIKDFTGVKFLEQTEKFIFFEAGPGRWNFVALK